ncbi:MAG: PAS domain-containing protein, partial [Gemmatimonadota bacterium]
MAAFGEAALMDEVVRASADIALKVDPSGRIRAVHFGESFAQESPDAWIGKSWEATVTGETRSKVVQLMEEANARGVARGRQVNHSLPTGSEAPVDYTAIRLGSTGDVLAIGRDLRAMSALQSRLIEAQQAMERDYWRLRQIETRYRLLFQFASEPVLIVGAESQEVEDANPAATDAFDLTGGALVGRRFPDDFGFDDPDALERHLETVRVQGRAEPTRVRTSHDGREWTIHASLVRQDPETFFLVRVTPGAALPLRKSTPGLDPRPYLDAVPDAVLLMDSRGEILDANRAFLDM